MARPSTPRKLITSLISSIPKPTEPQATTANPLLTTAETKDLLLTLHVLFQHELLPALDLLDRGLVTRFRLQTDPGPSNTSEANALNKPCTYYVRSAQQPPAPRAGNSGSKYRHAEHQHRTYYEVKLDAWSCSCPAFAFSAFPPMLESRAEQAVSDDDKHNSRRQEWQMGGLSLGSYIPICKHLLACVLIEYGNAFSHMAEERVVLAEESAGWAAGWGD